MKVPVSFQKSFILFFAATFSWDCFVKSAVWISYLNSQERVRGFCCETQGVSVVPCQSCLDLDACLHGFNESFCISHAVSATRSKRMEDHVESR